MRREEEGDDIVAKETILNERSDILKILKAIGSKEKRLTVFVERD